MTILRIETVTYGVDDMPACIAFMEDWGLEKLESGAAGAGFRTRENQHLLLRRSDDPGLPATEEDGPTVREIIWGVDSPEGLSAVAAELSGDRDIREDGGGTLHTRDDNGFAIGFAIADIAPADPPEVALNFHEDIRRINADNWPAERAAPLRIGHAVYSIRREGNRKAAQFYMERLKFRLTDRSEDGGTFLRCEGSNFHHTLFLFHRQGTRNYFNHLAFEMPSFDEIMTGGSHMKKSGAVSVSGPGRHSLGSNWFWYFENPCGGNIEYFADMDRMNDDWEPRYWEQSPPYARWMLGEDVLSG